MKRKQLCILATIALLVTLPLLATNETINYDDINKIKVEGMQRSQVMELEQLALGRLRPAPDGSPMILKAADWTMGKLKEWGLVNVKMEPWDEPERIRSRLDERQVLHAGHVAGEVPDSRHADRVDPRHQRPGRAARSCSSPRPRRKSSRHSKANSKGNGCSPRRRPKSPPCGIRQRGASRADELAEDGRARKQPEFGMPNPAGARRRGAAGAGRRPGSTGQPHRASARAAPPAGSPAQQRRRTRRSGRRQRP